MIAATKIFVPDIDKKNFHSVKYMYFFREKQKGLFNLKDISSKAIMTVSITLVLSIRAITKRSDEGSFMIRAIPVTISSDNCSRHYENVQ
jgi:hypothetical protein